MNKQLHFKDLFYVEKYTCYKEHTINKRIGFIYFDFPTTTKQRVVVDRNIIILVMNGSISLTYNQYVNCVFTAGDMIFIPKQSEVTGSILEDSSFIHMAFNAPINPHDKRLFEFLSDRIHEVEELNMATLRMNSPMLNFANSLIIYLKSNGDCPDLHEIKHQEMFMILRLYYTEDQFAKFFRPVIGKSFDFHDFVLDNYTSCHTIKDLIARSNMCKTVFMKKFKETFAVTAYQWMLEQVCKKIITEASQPGVTIKDVMFEAGIDSPTHFNRICRRHFNKTPKELINFCQKNI